MQHDELYLLKVGGSIDDLAQLSDLLDEGGVEGHTLWSPENGELPFISIYSETRDELDRIRESVCCLIDSTELAGRFLLESETTEVKDWMHAWKAFFHPVRISEHVVVRPSWEDWDGADPSVKEVIIDPGMSFGTGLHPTTRACIRFIDEINVSGSFLDAGCGSGILSICASMLGCHPVAGFDLDPVAVECARLNAARNGVAGNTAFQCASLGEYQDGRKYDIVAANILAPVLCANSATIAALVQAGGWLLLSGILTIQFDDLKQVFEAEGFEHNKSITEEEWTSGLFRRR